jgi:hypothetical protein
MIIRPAPLFCFLVLPQGVSFAWRSFTAFFSNKPLKRGAGLECGGDPYG